MELDDALEWDLWPYSGVEWSALIEADKAYGAKGEPDVFPAERLAREPTIPDRTGSDRKGGALWALSLVLGGHYLSLTTSQLVQAPRGWGRA